jgi:hypothetical protein
MKTMVESKEIKQDILMNIVARFPKDDWNYVINNQKKYKLYKARLISLRTKDRYKDIKNWDRIFDNKRESGKERNGSLNKRSIYIWCNNLIKDLKLLNCYNEPTKKKIYRHIKNTRDSLDRWIKEHEGWK